MTRFTLGCVLAIGLGLMVMADKAMAQTPYPNQGNAFARQPISPYLNMNRSGNPAINYYGLVKPQFDTTKQLQSLQQQVQQQQVMSQLGAAAEEDGMLASFAVTGHPAAFFNYSHYFGQAGTMVRPVQPPATIIRR